jgi:protein SCO1
MPARVRIALFVTAVLALGAAALATLLVRGDAGDTNGAAFAGSQRPAIPPKDFRLRDQDGRAVSLRDFRGDVVVLPFLYTTCRDTCPLTATQIRGALDDLGENVPTLAVSVDPANDTPERARRFVNEQHMTGRMRFMLGDPAALRPVWERFGIAPQREDLDHSAYIVLIDRNGRQRIGWPYEKLTTAGLAGDLGRLLDEA